MKLILIMIYIFSLNFLILKKKKKKEKTLIIFFDDFKTIITRRVMLIWIGIEIFLKTGKSYFFNFYLLFKFFQQFNAITHETKLKEKFIKLKDKNIKKYTIKKKREISKLYYFLKN